MQLAVACMNELCGLLSAHVQTFQKGAYTLGDWFGADEVSSCLQITWEDLKAAEMAVGEFGGDNRAGVEGTLHRISALRNRKGTVVGLTCRVGRAVTGHVDMIRDMIEGERNLCCENSRPCPGVHHKFHAVYVTSWGFCRDTLHLSITDAGAMEFAQLSGVRRIY